MHFERPIEKAERKAFSRHENERVRRRNHLSIKGTRLTGSQPVGEV